MKERNDLEARSYTAANVSQAQRTEAKGVRRPSGQGAACDDCTVVGGSNTHAGVWHIVLAGTASKLVLRYATGERAGVMVQQGWAGQPQMLLVSAELNREKDRAAPPLAGCVWLIPCAQDAGCTAGPLPAGT